MPYKVRIPDSVLERIRSVVPPIESQVRRCLAELGRKPRLGTPIRGGALDGLMAYQFRVTRAPLSREFAVLYAFDPDEDHIDILDFGVLGGSPLSLKPPKFEK
jgi:mRNA-degrading endonuclease RelE of RelBE toxin-antitoxin system